MSSTPAEVKVGHLILSMMRGLSDKALKWAALVMAFAVTGAIMYRPNPIRAAVACLFVGLLSPLWLRRGHGEPR
jgi:hypothetical protein